MTGVSLVQMFVHRYRWVYPAVAIYLTLLACIVRVPDSVMNPVLKGLLSIPFFFGMIATLAAFSNPESDLTSEASGYPPFLLRMPMRSIALALWPMLAGVLWGIGSWLGIAVLFLIPLGAQITNGDLVWSSAMIGALVVTFQALLWMPVRSGKLRLAVGLSVPLALLCGGLSLGMQHVDVETITLLFVLEGFAAGALAVNAVVRARTVGTVRVPLVAKPRLNVNRKAKAPFATPYAAQYWLEWHRQGRLLPILTGVALVLISVPLVREHDLYEQYYQGHMIMVNTWSWAMLPSLPWIPLLISTIIGMGVKKSDMRSEEGVYHLYYATRPIDSSEMLRAKYAAIGRGVLISWGMTIAVAFAWLSEIASDGVLRMPTWMFILRWTPVSQLALYAAMIVLAAVWTWRNQAIGAFVDFLPSRIAARLYPVAVTLLGAIYFSLFALSNQFLQRPESIWLVGPAFSLALGLKVWSAFLVKNKLATLRPSEGDFAGRAFASWLKVGAVTSLLFLWVANFYSSVGANVPILSPPVAVLAAFLVAPLVRPMAARLAIEQGRHQR
ncbi:hypothetical protein [Fimbriimonas ginsengisoli]|uniref:ABC-2 type transport system permease protein n=1 Tax=Fimbriimonas ginsengisoli Gsoil 348 TaxID=661478 RepID=A0A068NSY5_FIMGI|nr:hypothetical protein [Fimbriimonas ginsengisoli]AIE85885.1 hypothetical protein OP10G_2517 [Fimbriimonas ginsengisoli Gsoil 348]